MRFSFLTLTALTLLVTGVPMIAASPEGCNDPNANGAVFLPALEAATGDPNKYYLYLNFQAGKGAPTLEWWKETNQQSGLQTQRLTCNGFPMKEADTKLDAAPLP